MIAHIQNGGHVGVDGVTNVDGAGLRIGHVKLERNFQIPLACNGRTVVHGGHQSVLVLKVAAQRNVNVREGGGISALLNAEKIELVSVGLDSAHGKHVMINQLFQSQRVGAKFSKVGFLETKFFVVKTKVEMFDAVLLKDVLIGAFAKIVGARSNLFVEAKNQDRFREENVLKDGSVSGGSVGNWINQLKTGDAWKFNLGSRGQLFVDRRRKPGLFQTHFKLLDDKSIGLGGSDPSIRFSKNVILLVKKCKPNVQFSQTIQGQEPGNRICHKVGAQKKRPLKEREKIKFESRILEDVGCVIFPSFGRGCPLIFLLRHAIGWMCLLRTEISLRGRMHIVIEHGVKIGRDESLFVGAGNSLVIVKHVHRFDQHFKPIELQNDVGNVGGSGKGPIGLSIFLDIETSLDKKFGHGTEKNRLGGRKFKINLGRRLVSVQICLVERIDFKIFGTQKILIANVLPRRCFSVTVPLPFTLGFFRLEGAIFRPSFGDGGDLDDDGDDSCPSSDGDQSDATIPKSA